VWPLNARKRQALAEKYQHLCFIGFGVIHADAGFGELASEVE
jgi:hypothetical protein